MRDSSWLRRAALLAARGRLRVEPNPPVGCVVVRGGRTVGEGWPREWGRAHAEREALRRAGAATRGATVFVTLEPCGHAGKTPPCADAL
ncbi:MAG: deaminase, partial [Planctomycetota bacterium]